MRRILKIRKSYPVLFFVYICLTLLSACGGITPDSNPPTISSFTASSTSITEGESVTLSWVTNATSVSIDQGIGTVTSPSGSTTVIPASTTTYTLTATNSAGSDTNSIAITVNPAPVVDQTITIQPGSSEGKDSYVRVGYPDDNFGNQGLIWIGHMDTLGSFRAYLQFKLSDLPVDALITSAVLELFLYNYYTSTGDPQDFDLGVYRVNGSWKENDITWNTRPGYTSTPTPESTYPVTLTYLVNPDDVTWLSWNITSLVQGWLDGSIPNYGVELRDTDETTGNVFIQCYSSDDITNVAKRPKLVITYHIQI